LHLDGRLSRRGGRGVAIFAKKEKRINVEVRYVSSVMSQENVRATQKLNAGPLPPPLGGSHTERIEETGRKKFRRLGHWGYTPNTTHCRRRQAKENENKRVLRQIRTQKVAVKK
jgi:hypothetical protein